MSKEREFLKKLRYASLLENDLRKELEELLAQPEQEQEPVAWIIETEIHGKLSEWICTDKKHYMEEHDSIKEPIPLYTAPPKHEPLSDGEITDLWANKSPANEFECVRLVEKAHGIGGEE